MEHRRIPNFGRPNRNMSGQSRSVRFLWFELKFGAQFHTHSLTQTNEQTHSFSGSLKGHMEHARTRFWQASLQSHTLSMSVSAFKGPFRLNYSFSFPPREMEKKKKEKKLGVQLVSLSLWPNIWRASKRKRRKRRKRRERQEMYLDISVPVSRLAHPEKEPFCQPWDGRQNMSYKFYFLFPFQELIRRVWAVPVRVVHTREIPLEPRTMFTVKPERMWLCYAKD